jgi:hypothetical protein
MATLMIQTQVVNVGGGTYTAAVIIKDQSGIEIDRSESDPITVANTEIIQLDVLKPTIHLRGSGERKN